MGESGAVTATATAEPTVAAGNLPIAAKLAAAAVCRASFGIQPHGFSAIKARASFPAKPPARFAAPLALAWAIALAVLCALCLRPAAAFADTVEVTPLPGADAYSMVQKALNTAKTTATDKNPLTVKVTPGSYTLTHSLRLYSNTTIDLTDVTLTVNKTATCNAIRIGEAVDTQAGYYYKNINIVGGTIDNNGRTNTAIKLAHAKYVTMKNTTVRNARNGHLVEVGGVAYLTVDGCTFRDQVQVGTYTMIPEAFQIDVLNNKHFPGHLPEALPVKYLTVTNCTFANVPRGIGAHTAVLNQYVSHVTIKNNTFTNMRSAAIQAMNFYHCLIEGNTIKNAPAGIVVYMGHSRGMYFASTLAKQGGVATTVAKTYKAPAKKQDVVIRNNTITASGYDCYTGNAPRGIFLCGWTFSRKLSSGSVEWDPIPAGNYYVSGVTVKGNTIKTTGHGIMLDDARNSTIASNKITFTGNRSGAMRYGVYLLSGATKNVIKSNTIAKFSGHGILLTSKSSATSITSNTITSPKKYGISIQGSTATTIKKIISSPGSYGINVLVKGYAKTISSNRIRNVKKAAIYIDTTKKSKITIKSNKFSGKKAAKVVKLKEGKVKVSGSKLVKEPKKTTKK